jgi:hypothetical protein
VRAALCAGVLAAALFACVSYDELPLCGPYDWGAAATRVCSDSDEVTAWRASLAQLVLRRSQWVHPMKVPLHVGVDDRGRVGPVCVGSATADPGWSTRDRVAASLRQLRAAPPAPACLAGTTVDLTAALVEGGAPASYAGPIGMIACEPDARDRDDCSQRIEWVCGTLDDDTRKPYRNACEACSDRRVLGFFETYCF